MIIYAQIENDSFYWLTRLTVYITSLTDVFDGHIHIHLGSLLTFQFLSAHLLSHCSQVLATLDVLNI